MSFGLLHLPPVDRELVERMYQLAATHGNCSELTSLLRAALSSEHRGEAEGLRERLSSEVTRLRADAEDGDEWNHTMADHLERLLAGDFPAPSDSQGEETVGCFKCGKRIAKATACYCHDNRKGVSYRCDPDCDPASTQGGDGECLSCGSEAANQKCPKSKRPCGHHCNCSWTHEHCHWCGQTFGESTNPTPQPRWMLWRAKQDGPDDWNLLTAADRPHLGQEVEYIEVAPVEAGAGDGFRLKDLEQEITDLTAYVESMKAAAAQKQHGSAYNTGRADGAYVGLLALRRLRDLRQPCDYYKRLVKLADIIGAVHKPGADPELHEDDARFLRELADFVQEAASLCRERAAEVKGGGQ